MPKFYTIRIRLKRKSRGGNLVGMEIFFFFFFWNIMILLLQSLENLTISSGRFYFFLRIFIFLHIFPPSDKLNRVINLISIYCNDGVLQAEIWILASVVKCLWLYTVIEFLSLRSESNIFKVEMLSKQI